MSNENQYAIVTENLDLWYGDFQALEKVSLNLRGGIITGLIGPSGGPVNAPSLYTLVFVSLPSIYLIVCSSI